MARGAIGWQVSPSACAVNSPPGGASSCQNTQALLQSNSMMRPPPFNAVLPFPLAKVCFKVIFNKFLHNFRICPRDMEVNLHNFLQEAFSQCQSTRVIY